MQVYRVTRIVAVGSRHAGAAAAWARIIRNRQKRLRSKRRAVNDDTAPFVVGGRLTGGTMRVRGEAPVRAGDGAAPSCTLKTPTTTDDDQSSSFSRDPESDRRHRVSTRFVHLCCSLG